jgi:clan AA aspartic protease
MITGTVKPSREAVVWLKIRGTTGLELDVEAVVDTGFTESLTLPRARVNALGLPFAGADGMALADGSILSVDLYAGAVEWDGRDRPAIIHCVEGSPLLGMSLLYDPLMRMEVVDNGHVTIDPLP